MNLGRIRLQLAAGVALAAAGVLGGIGLGLLLYAVLKIWLVPPVAAGISFLIFAAGAFVASLLIKSGASHGHKASHDHGHAAAGDSAGGGLPARVLDMARRKPVLALVGGGLLAAVALRNPAILATLVGAAIDRGLGGGRRR